MPIKLNGKVPGVYEDVVVIPRPTGNFALCFRAIDDYAEFDQLCHMPKPPAINYPDGTKGENIKDVNYLIAKSQREKKRIDWMFLKSISITPGLEWGRVKLDDPSTWHMAQDELAESGLSVTEVNRVWRTFLEVNSLSEAKLEEARASFLQQTNELVTA